MSESTLTGEAVCRVSIGKLETDCREEGDDGVKTKGSLLETYLPSGRKSMQPSFDLKRSCPDGERNRELWRRVYGSWVFGTAENVIE